MRAALVLLAAVSASAQTGEDARPLLESISQAVRSAGSVRAEGIAVDESAGQGGPSRRETHFELVTQGPLLMRLRVTYGPNRILQVCDGTSRWNYLEVLKSYTRTTEDEELCDPRVARWGDLTEHLVSAKVTGRDHSEFEGRSRECEAIEAVYQTKLLLPALPAVGLLTRSFCVDPVRLLILRERLEAAPRPGEVTHYSRTVTYSRVAYDSPQPADIFQFRPPAGSSDGRVSLPLAGEGGSDAGWLGSGGTPAPVLIFKHEPQYTPEALKAKLQGTVLVSLVIDEEGRPQNIRVVRGLGMGLDEKAIEAVSTWWFEPGYGAGLPIAVPARVEVNFRIP